MIRVVTQMRAVLLFYRSVAPFVLGVSALLLGFVLLPLLLEGKAGGSLPTLLLVKVLTYPVVCYLAEQMRPDQYWFFFNLGLTRRRLWTSLAALDSLLFLGVAVLLKSLLA
ncbi:hypothetical protein [Hymenobacter negativus]|uniref:ABC transporter permease n=1 Tax=Hymenobacter negativus TaxID=2795026 RepID=A0ABS3QAC6_9BACT|nr:hypothetical protein [Hymenobacter negativus]MBO2008203.1 hypothetical protein [Hymenobacter negativus]